MNTEIRVSVGNKTIAVPRGTTVADVFSKAGLLLDGRYEDNPIVGARINGELQPLGYCILTEKANAEPIQIFDFYGRRIYRHSLVFLLCMAANQLFPHRSLSVWHSMYNALYFGFTDGETISRSDIDAITSRMKSIARNNYPIEFTALPCEEAIKYFKKQKEETTVSLLSNQNNPNVALYKVEEFYDIAYEPLAPRTGLLTVWDLIPYTERGMLLRYPESDNVTEVGPVRDNPKLFGVFQEYKQWGKILGVSCLGQMNRKVTGGTVEEYIRLSESLQKKKMFALADNIVNKNAKSVFISGPSSSGKTTFAKKLCEQLSLMGYNPIQISLDDYYKPRTDIPRDKNGEIDYECLEALRTDLFNDTMQAIFKGEEVKLPKWSFAKQERTFHNKSVKLDEFTVFVIEGIHALNPVFTSCVPQDSLYKVYISALTQLTLDNHNRISTTDTRILRRIIRDNRTRDISASETLAMWKSVTKGEKKHIFPFQMNADTMFNTSLDYEIGVLSTYAIPLLSEVGPDKGGAYTEARRLLSFLKNINPIPAGPVPSDSLLREFIGDSDYED